MFDLCILPRRDIGVWTVVKGTGDAISCVIMKYVSMVFVEWIIAVRV